jgi:hypothetical protein
MPAPGARLSPGELAFFKAYGYLRKPAALDPALCARARDAIWAALSVGNPLRRDDPRSWSAPVSRAHGEELRFPFDGHTGGPGDLREGLIVRNRLVAGWAGQLLGEGSVDLGARARNRGVICALPAGARPLRPGVAPNTDDGRGRELCHNDGHAMHLGVIGLLDRVPKGGGATMVWPASHSRVFHKYSQQCANGRRARDGAFIDGQQAYSGDPGLVAEDSEFAAEMRRLNADTDPVDTFGEAGDMFFWHHRLGHSGSTNRSSTIRQAVFYDFCHANMAEVGSEPPPRDMWRDWGEELRNAPGSWSLALAEEQRLVGRKVAGVRVVAQIATAPFVNAPARTKL